LFTLEGDPVAFASATWRVHDLLDDGECRLLGDLVTDRMHRCLDEPHPLLAGRTMLGAGCCVGVLATPFATGAACSRRPAGFEERDLGECRVVVAVEQAAPSYRASSGGQRGGRLASTSRG
jgi:hypothetical protein